MAKNKLSRQTNCDQSWQFFNGLQSLPEERTQETVCEVLTNPGWSLKSTQDTKIWTRTDTGFEGWKLIQDIEIGDYLAIERGTDYFGNYDIPLDEAYTLGLYIADGSIEVCKSRFQIDKQEPVVLAIKPVIEKWLKECGSNSKIRIDSRSSYHARIVTHCKEMVTLLRKKYGIVPTYSEFRTIPTTICNAQREVVKSFLRGYIDGDGYCSSGVVEVSTASRILAEQVGMMLIGLGIYCSLTRKSVKSGLDAHIITIRDIEQFEKQIGMTSYGLKKDTAYKEFLKIKRNTNYDTVPGIGCLIKSAAQLIPNKMNRKDSWSYIANYYDSKKKPSYHLLEYLESTLPDSPEKAEMNRILYDNYIWVPVTETNTKSNTCAFNASFYGVVNGFVVS